MKTQGTKKRDKPGRSEGRGRGAAGSYRASGKVPFNSTAPSWTAGSARSILDPCSSVPQSGDE